MRLEGFSDLRKLPPIFRWLLGIGSAFLTFIATGFDFGLDKHLPRELADNLSLIALILLCLLAIAVIATVLTSMVTKIKEDVTLTLVNGNIEAISNAFGTEQFSSAMTRAVKSVVCRLRIKKDDTGIFVLVDREIPEKVFLMFHLLSDEVRNFFYKITEKNQSDIQYCIETLHDHIMRLTEHTAALLWASGEIETDTNFALSIYVHADMRLLSKSFPSAKVIPNGSRSSESLPYEPKGLIRVFEYQNADDYTWEEGGVIFGIDKHDFSQDIIAGEGRFYHWSSRQGPMKDIHLVADNSKSISEFAAIPIRFNGPNESRTVLGSLNISSNSQDEIKSHTTSQILFAAADSLATVVGIWSYITKEHHVVAFSSSGGARK
jgi:hypothetical protein